MTIRRVDAEETEDQRTDREEQEAAAEKARVDREIALEERARENELKAAKAEAALEEARRSRSQENFNTSGPTEAQWQELENQNPGKSRQEIQAEANKMAAIADARMKPLSERASAAEERAAKAEERAARLESRRGLDKVEDSFYKKNPALEPHKAEVESFLSEFPDNDRVDAKTLEKRLGMASEYVKGKVKNLRSEPRRGEFSSRQVDSEGEQENNHNEHTERFDPKGTGGNRGAVILMEGVVENFGKNLKHEDSEKFWKESLDEEGRGVEISSKEDVDRAKRLISRGSNLGGQRGER